MDLSQLQSIVKIAEEGSVTRAADALYLTQPAVTQQMRALERELGVPLLERTGRGIRLTEPGWVLVDYARRVFSLLDECRQVIGDLQEGVAGRLTIGAGVTTSIIDLPKWLEAFGENYPGTDVVVRTGRSREITSMVLDREVDLGLVTSLGDHPDLESSVVCEERFVLVARAESQFAGKTITPEELANAPLVLFPKPSGFRDGLDRALGDLGVSARVKMETDSVEAIKGFVAVGLGVSFLPESVVTGELRSGALSAVHVEGMPVLERVTYLIYRKDRYLSTAGRRFLSIVTG